jgi:dihydrofolate reductase
VAKLIYSAITSLDGYIADDAGTFEWAMPDAEVHTLVNDLERPVGTYLYGRRMYEVRIERKFDPEAVRTLKAEASQDLSVGGSDLAAQAFEAGLVDECQLFLTPILVGGGTRSLPDGVRAQLELLDERRFGNGMVHLRYRIRS